MTEIIEVKQVALEVLTEQKILELDLQDVKSWFRICRKENAEFFILNNIPVTCCGVFIYPVELKISINEDINIKGIASFMVKQKLLDGQHLENFSGKLKSMKEAEVIRFINEFDEYIKSNNVRNWTEVLQKGIAQFMAVKIESKEKYSIYKLVEIMLPEKQEVDFLIEFFEFQAIPGETFNNFCKRFKFLWKFTKIEESQACGKLYSAIPLLLKQKIVASFIGDNGKKVLGISINLMINKVKNFIGPEEVISVDLKRKFAFGNNGLNWVKRKNNGGSIRCFKCGLIGHVSRLCKTDPSLYDLSFVKKQL